MNAYKNQVVKRGPGRPRRVGQPRAPDSWPTDIDWSQTDAAIGERLGVSRQRVNQVRKLLGKKRIPPPSPITLALAWLERNRHRVPNLYAEEAAEKARVSVNAIREAASRLKVRFRRASYRASWRNMPINWNLPSSDLQEIWRLPPNTVPNARSRGWAPRPKWHRFLDRKNRAYQAAVKREKRKAKRYRQANKSTSQRVNRV